MRLAPSLLTGLMLFAALPAHAAEPEPIAQFVLENGLEVIVIPNHRVPAVSHMLWYRVGAADDPPGKSGLAHYHEHLMYQGTQTMKSGEYSKTIAAQGGQENAFTGHDATSYYVNISKDKLPLAMRLEADRMRALLPLEADVAKEKEVILEERRQRVENNPGALLSEQVNAAMFRNHPYHVPVIGWMHEMQGLTLADVQEFHRRYYHPNNAMLIVSGDVTPAEVKQLAQEYYGPLPKAEVPPRHWLEEPPQNAPRRIALSHPNVRQPSWSRDYYAPSVAYGGKEKSLPLMLLSQLLGGGKTSRLYQALVLKQKVATQVDVDYNGFSLGPAQFSIGAVPAQGVDLAALEKAVDAELAGLLKGDIGDKELARAKTLLKAETIFARDGLSNMANIMGWVRICGLDADYFTRWPQLIDAVSAEQVKAAAKDVLKLNAAVTSELLPEARP
ncbi:MAG: insulinase family protein [Proteobacteria bacterium]|nr:insulinase family protein [Pseudomonadota bacterium]